MFTRETKVGLVVASSFLFLVGIVLVTKLRDRTASGPENGDVAAGPEGPKPLAEGKFVGLFGGAEDVAGETSYLGLVQDNGSMRLLPAPNPELVRANYDRTAPLPPAANNPERKDPGFSNLAPIPEKKENTSFAAAPPTSTRPALPGFPEPNSKPEKALPGVPPLPNAVVSAPPPPPPLPNAGTNSAGSGGGLPGFPPLPLPVSPPGKKDETQPKFPPAPAGLGASGGTLTVPEPKPVAVRENKTEATSTAGSLPSLPGLSQNSGNTGGLNLPAMPPPNGTASGAVPLPEPKFTGAMAAAPAPEPKLNFSASPVPSVPEVPPPPAVGNNSPAFVRGVEEKKESPAERPTPRSNEPAPVGNFVGTIGATKNASPERPAVAMGRDGGAVSPSVTPTLRPRPQVESFDEETYRSQANDTFKAISLKLYRSDKYERALMLYNRNHPLARPELQRETAALSAGVDVYIPPTYILEKSYGGHIPDLVPLAPNRANSPDAPRVAPTSFSSPNQAVGRSTPAPETPRPTYQVQQDDESFWSVAKSTLNNGNRWNEIYTLNKTLDPQKLLPRGQVLQLPRDARVPGNVPR